MAIFKRAAGFESKQVLDLPIAAISPNPGQPRTNFSPAALEELAQSIAVHGILQPLTVRRAGNGWQLISGERRLRAAKLAGLDTVPCLVAQVDQEESSLLALVENLQRRDLDFLEEALALSQLISTYRLTQEDAARRLGKSQSAIANKLRLLRLCPDALALLRSGGFGERHARALLRLPDDAAQFSAARAVVNGDLTVAATEALVDKLLVAGGEKKPTPRTKVILRDVRLFLNSLTKNLRLVQSAGIPAKCERSETEGEITLTITLPKCSASGR